MSEKIQTPEEQEAQLANLLQQLAKRTDLQPANQDVAIPSPRKPRE